MLRTSLLVFSWISCLDNNADSFLIESFETLPMLI